jgi:hypothetical protein
MKYTFENSEKCDRCGDTTSEKCELIFGGIKNTLCLRCKDIRLLEIDEGRVSEFSYEVHFASIKCDNCGIISKCKLGKDVNMCIDCFFK